MRADAMIFSSLGLLLAVMAKGGQGQLSQDYSVTFWLDKTDFQLQERISISYTPRLLLPITEPVRNLSIFLLETSASDGVQIGTLNTVKLLDIQSGK